MIWALLVGYVIGSIPSADAIARMRGHDLRRSGTGNPGTANALRVAGRGAAITILLVDLLKGAAAALLGEVLAQDAGAVWGGIAAVAGQVLNPWFGFRGGKGLGVTAGVTAVVWPWGLLVVLPFTVAGARLFNAAFGAVLGLTAYLVGAIGWASNDLPRAWGAATDDGLVWLAVGIVSLTLPKFIVDLVRR